MATEARLKAVQKYQKKAMTQIAIRFHNVNDATVIEKIKSQKNQADYIRKLVEKDIKENG